MEEELVQQLMETWLTYASGNTESTIDEDDPEFGGYAGTYDLLDVIQEAAEALESGENLEYYTNLCDAINNSGPE